MLTSLICLVIKFETKNDKANIVSMWRRRWGRRWGLPQQAVPAFAGCGSSGAHHAGHPAEAPEAVRQLGGGIEVLVAPRCEKV